MSEIMVEITQAVIIIAVVVVMKYLIPWIKARLDLSQYEWVLQVVDDAVQYAEQTITGIKSGQRKLEMVTRYVRECVDEKNYNMSDEQIRALIESSVFTMKEMQNGD